MASMFMNSADLISSSRIYQELGADEPVQENINQLLKYLISIEPSVWMDMLIYDHKVEQELQEQVASANISTILQYFRAYLLCLLCVDEATEAHNLLKKIRATLDDTQLSPLGGITALAVFDPFEEAITSAQKLYEFESAKKIWYSLVTIDEQQTGEQVAVKVSSQAGTTVATATSRLLKVYARLLFKRMYEFVVKVFKEINLKTLVGYLGIDQAKYETAHDLLVELQAIHIGWSLNEDTGIFNVPYNTASEPAAKNETERKHQLSVLVDYATFLTNKGIFNHM
ncbi:hypothetical protein NADFUDRAFT_39993 [Nadsonia fulvescens var. elongata DSM 6958]|uniref:PCI domain-containing protein n=1 Tax=Nadsonia fulvescens var. elongata DSM 6958 TaxID=857566 RepID=A0A1E3PT72_9ASCO|nr:hypothetical protein NADFUDRAFT_39993 [Nadsonia fulvescens var. elongata DSM 6958]